MAALGLHGYPWAFSSCSERGLLSACGAWAALVVECGLQGVGSVIVVCCPEACGLFPEGSHPCPLRWQMDS